VAKLLIEAEIDQLDGVEYSVQGIGVEHLDRDSELGTPLQIAVNADDKPMVRLLLKLGACPCILTFGGGSALHAAARSGNLAIMRMLLARVGEMANDGSMVFDDEPSLVDTETSDGETPLHFAASAGHVAIVRLLLASGANPNAVSEAGETPLFQAAGQGCLAVVKAIVAAGAHVDGETDMRPLAAAARKRHVPIVKYLLKAGAITDTERTDDGARRFPTKRKRLTVFPRPKALSLPELLRKIGVKLPQRNAKPPRTARRKPRKRCT